MLRITPRVSISEQELEFSFARSPGPGGQNTNKVNTRVTLLFDVQNSPSLTTSQRKRIKSKLSTRINNQGILRVVSSKERTQLANRRAAVNRFVTLLADALHTPKPRRKTRPPASVNRRRLDTKRKRGQLKQSRSKRIDPSEA
jgi:ribosome-associated protein